MKGAFAELRKATIRFFMPVFCPFFSVCLSVRPSVLMEQLGYQWNDFRKKFFKIWFPCVS